MQLSIHYYFVAQILLLHTILFPFRFIIYACGNRNTSVANTYYTFKTSFGCQSI